MDEQFENIKRKMLLLIILNTFGIGIMLFLSWAFYKPLIPALYLFPGSHMFYVWYFGIAGVYGLVGCTPISLTIWKRLTHARELAKKHKGRESNVLFNQISKPFNSVALCCIADANGTNPKADSERYVLTMNGDPITLLGGFQALTAPPQASQWIAAKAVRSDDRKSPAAVMANDKLHVVLMDLPEVYKQLLLTLIKRK